MVGIVTSRDLLRVFLRPKKEVAERVRELLDDMLSVDQASDKVTVRESVMIHTDNQEVKEERELIQVKIRLI